MNLEEFQHLPLRGGFLLLRVALTTEPMVDALERPALARTTIIGSNIEVELCGINPDAGEISVSLYHEVLEAATVAAVHPPASVCELNEAGFEARLRTISWRSRRFQFRCLRPVVTLLAPNVASGSAPTG